MLSGSMLTLVVAEDGVGQTVAVLVNGPETAASRAQV